MEDVKEHLREIEQEENIPDDFYNNILDPRHLIPRKDWHKVKARRSAAKKFL